jgi:hypothetical protein
MSRIERTKVDIDECGRHGRAVSVGSERKIGVSSLCFHGHEIILRLVLVRRLVLVEKDPPWPQLLASPVRRS